ncbi:MAG: TonB-dependent receptor [Proteobacteria bacterium]|nr:TonB-dependent receptor [Pseudomonadota bacterium]
MKLPPIVTAAGLVLLASPVSLAVAQETGSDDSFDEIVVTGTFIRRSEGFTPASPVQEISKADFEANAPRTVADFLTQLPYSFNTTFTVGRALGSSNGSGSLNLRNLGSDATLVLLNGRRVARDAVTVGNVDVNSLVPQIAIERIDVLKDGASSLYGSDAVGGVANFLTRRNFQGFEVQAQGDQRDYGNTTDYRVSGIWGAQTEKSGVVVAVEHFNRDPFSWETYEIIRKRPGIDGAFRLAGWPARYSIPNRNAAGALAGAATTIADPACAAFGPSANTTGNPVTRLGVSYPSNCQQNAPLGTSANADENRYQAFIEAHHEINDSLKFYGEAGFLRTRTALVDTPGAAANPGPGQPAVIVPGYAPSNSFRAMNSAGVALYAQSSGVQLGFDKDGNGVNDFLPARSAAGQVIVVGTDPAALGANGLPVVPFWEDVTVVAGSRIFGMTCNLPGNPATTYNCRNDLNSTRYAVDAQRYVAGLEGDLFGGAWHYNASYLLAVNGEDDTTFGSAFSMPALRAGLAGYGGSGCLTPSNDPLLAGTNRPGAGNCRFFNIFGSSVTTAPGTLLANTPDMVTYITAQDWQRYETKASVLDFVLSGELFSLPAGRIGVAIGAQHRADDWSADYPALQNSGQSDLQAAFFDKKVGQISNAIFAELSVPLMKNEQYGLLDFTGAVRYENTGGPGLSTTDPKLGLLYSSPAGMVKVRGTWSTSFLAPSLYQRFRQNVVFTNAVNDGLTAANDNLSRVPTTVAGNPSLDPQTSENYNLGFTLKPWNNWSLDVDYWHFTFDGQISLENAVELASNLTTTLDPSKVIRNPAAGTVLWNGVNVGPIVGFNVNYINNASLKSAGFDFALNNTQDLGNFGALRSSILASYQSKYELNGRDISQSRNARTAGGSFSVPWRATMRNVWSLGSHSVQSLLRYTDEYYNDQNPNAGTLAKQHIEKYFTWDLSYSYELGERFGLKSSQIAVGANNVMDKAGPYVPDGNHTLSSMYDYSGRHLWLRLKAAF